MIPDIHLDSAQTATPWGPVAHEASPESVEAPVSYLVPTGARPKTYIPAPGTGETRRTGRYADYRVSIHDARAFARDLSLDRQGFVLTRHDTEFVDFQDPEAVRRFYYPEMEQLVREATGAARVVAFDHNVRADGEKSINGGGLREPVRVVHNDYTEKSGPQRVRDLLPPEQAEALLQNRFAVINVWRPIKWPVQTTPLALADAHSIGPDDLVPLDLVYSDRTGEIYNAAYSPLHRWYYFTELKTDEAVLIKGYDSKVDGTARFTLHTAFDDPTTADDARPRQSIETRTLAFFNS